ncbi:kinase-like protein [Punctularia strigosozonata HHB-11173 SS5]|uniref:kinase-like protein n=1 Tax=Punctularia strigosozonata (strain HHB-11173) TaxID=741275 RepID=UPI00044167CC|nr:kinase-like protein [Punctularia strigosozonata HHB-11173 SS5]EIN11732.1 kinase-like protein [Punctularia strigosozonata HHB-11173 SS5]
MLTLQVSSPSPDPARQPQFPPPTLADLSRNASVISSSSSSSSTSSLHPLTPPQRPIRTFSSPRSRSPPTTPTGSRPPPFLRNGLNDAAASMVGTSPPRTRAQSRVRGSRNNSASARPSAADFEFGDILGEGSYSTVMYGKSRATGQEYAIKVLDKAHLKRNNKLQTALAEKDSLVRLGSGHPGIVRLHYAFHDEWSLYFVLDYAPNGELQSRISRMGSLSTTCARYYAAQLVDALEYMHNRGVIHRDLKPENLLLDKDFRIKITDFGTGKIVDSAAVRSKTFVGTAQYVSPELLESSETSKSSDLWALGCIIYQMIAGRFTFTGLSEYLTWQKIKALEYTFPDGFDEDAKDLVTRLLLKDPAARLGAGPPESENSMEALRSHPFFKEVNWKTLWTDPAPPLEAGLVKKALPSPGNGDFDDLEIDSGRWDVGWDDVPGLSRRGSVQSHGAETGEAEGEDSETEEDMRRPQDEMEWAPDAQTGYQTGERKSEQGVGEVGYGYAGGGLGAYTFPATTAPAGGAEEQGPLGEAPRYDYALAHAPAPAVPVGGHLDVSPAMRERSSSTSSAATDATDATDATELAAEREHAGVPVPVPAGKQEDVAAAAAVGYISAGSATSQSSSSGGSGGGSPIERLGAALQSMGFDRGRSRAQTPVQGHSPSPRAISTSGSGSSEGHCPAGELPHELETGLNALLFAGERVLYTGGVEAGSLRRRASRLLLPASVAGRHSKVRQLVLTNRRLVLAKRKEGGVLSVKVEMSLVPVMKERSPETPKGHKGGEKEKGKREGGGFRVRDKEGKETPKTKEVRMTLVTGIEPRGDRSFELLTVSARI